MSTAPASPGTPGAPDAQAPDPELLRLAQVAHLTYYRAAGVRGAVMAELSQPAQARWQEVVRAVQEAERRGGELMPRTADAATPTDQAVQVLAEHQFQHPFPDEDGELRCRCGTWIGARRAPHQPDQASLQAHQAEVLAAAGLLAPAPTTSSADDALVEAATDAAHRTLDRVQWDTDPDFGQIVGVTVEAVLSLPAVAALLAPAPVTDEQVIQEAVNVAARVLAAEVDEHEDPDGWLGTAENVVRAVVPVVERALAARATTQPADDEAAEHPCRCGHPAAEHEWSDSEWCHHDGCDCADYEDTCLTDGSPCLAAGAATPAPAVEDAVLVGGSVGWRNSADARTASQLDVYGPGGRWGGRDRQGEALIDALEREGITEGARLLVIAVNRGQGDPRAALSSVPRTEPGVPDAAEIERLAEVARATFWQQMAVQPTPPDEVSPTARHAWSAVIRAVVAARTAPTEGDER